MFEEDSSTAVAEPVIETDRRRKEQKRQKPKRQPRYHVVLWDDSDHSYEYVVRMMKEVFRFPIERGFEIAKTVDTTGRAICFTTTKEHAELKCDQIHSYGKDDMIPRCAGSMSASIEPEPS